MNKGDLLFKIGLLIYIITMFISYIINKNTIILDFLMGFGIGIAIVGIVKQIIDKKQQKIR